MSEHPIQGLMKTAMESIKEMVDVNTVVGDAVEAPDGTVIIPVSRVTCGFAAGGSDFSPSGEKSEGSTMPFGGGSGAGVSVYPMGFLVVGNGQVRMMTVDGKSSMIERIAEIVPGVIDSLKGLVAKRQQGKTGTAPNQGDEVERITVVKEYPNSKQE